MKSNLSLVMQVLVITGSLAGRCQPAKRETKIIFGLRIGDTASAFTWRVC